ncbi:transposase, partial [Francisella tularensis]
VQILYLPPYSPDLNPIEKVWANFKKIIRFCAQKT